MLGIDSITRWVLARAFGPENVEAVPPAVPAEALLRAGALGVAPRIAARNTRELLVEDLGRTAAAGFEREARKALEATLAYDALAETLARHATGLDHCVVFLKGYALHAGGHASPGSRSVGDLDVLVLETRVEQFHQVLQAAGFEPASGARNEQHLPPLAAPGWGVVDLHYALRGVCDEVGAWLDASAVLSAGGCQEVSPGAWVPAPPLLAAHALAHAIEQHGNNPRPYPLLRMVADINDLLPDEGAWAAALPTLLRSLHSTLEPAEVEAARDLALLLAAGRLPSSTDAGAEQLLAHFLSHALDRSYRAGLGRRHLQHRLKQARKRGTLLRYASRKLRDLWRRVAAESRP